MLIYLNSMLHASQTAMKLGKSVLNELICKKLQYALIFNTIKSISANIRNKYELSTLIYYFKPKICQYHSGDYSFKRNKHKFGCNYSKFIINVKSSSAAEHLQVRIKKNKTIADAYRPITFIHKILKSNSDKLAISRKFCTCPPQPPPSEFGRHCYHEETENAINRQILAELNACYAYLSIACFFGRTEIALPGCHGFFMKMHEEEHEHALYFVKYQLLRGGQVQLCPLNVPESQDWKNITTALSAAVEMEKSVKEQLVTVYDVAEKHHDLNVMDVISATFIEEQERSICELSRLLMRATNLGTGGMADYLFDKEVHRAFVKKSKKKGTAMTTDNNSDLYV